MKFGNAPSAVPIHKALHRAVGKQLIELREILLSDQPPILRNIYL